LAISAWNLLSTAQGSLDWAGVEIVFGLLGVEDEARMIHLLGVIKHHSNRK